MIALGVLLCAVAVFAPARADYPTVKAGPSCKTAIGDLHFYPGSNMTQIHGKNVHIDKIVCSPIGAVETSLWVQCTAFPDNVVLTSVDITSQLSDNGTWMVLSEGRIKMYPKPSFSNFHLFYGAELLSDNAPELRDIRATPARHLPEVDRASESLGYKILSFLVVIFLFMSPFILISFAMIAAFILSSKMSHRPILLVPPLRPTPPAPPAPDTTAAWRKHRRALTGAHE